MEKTNPADAPAFPLDLYDEPGDLIRRPHQAVRKKGLAGACFFFSR